jgi:hypothetical protein
VGASDVVSDASDGAARVGGGGVAVHAGARQVPPRSERVLENRWGEDLRLQVEVLDVLDEFVLFSGEGQMRLSRSPLSIRICGADRCEYVGPAFSAASRDPVQRRFANIDDYFEREADTNDQGFMIRVYVRDERTGRQAVLWDGYYEGGELMCVNVAQDELRRPHLPEGSRYVTPEEYFDLYSPLLPGRGLGASVGFHVRPEPDQEGVAEADKMWRVAGGDEDNYEEHASFFRLDFDDHVTEDQLASLTRGLLQP